MFLKKTNNPMIISTKNNEILLSIDPDINPLIKMLSNYEVDGLSIEEPSLEDIFLDYYKESNQEDLSS